MGSLTNQLVYLTTVFHLKSVTAATIMNIFSGTASMVPLLGAFISDNYVGRYTTIGVASMASMLVVSHTFFLFTVFFSYFGSISCL
jgi:dipeptide/tripeptide permease